LFLFKTAVRICALFESPAGWLTVATEFYHLFSTVFPAGSGTSVQSSSPVAVSCYSFRCRIRIITDDHSFCFVNTIHYLIVIIIVNRFVVVTMLLTRLIVVQL
jgi:hypothetical protein